MQADDYNAIRNLVHDYAYRLDHGDVEGVGDLFANASVWFGEGSEPVRGDAASVSNSFRDWLQLYDGIPRTRHAMSNLQIWPDGDARARATCYVMVFQQTPTLSLQPIIGGDYLDRFERHDGVWRFSERVIRNDMFGDLSAHGRYRLGLPAARNPGAEQADIEAIRQLKARYFRFLDCKDWDSLATLLAENATIGLLGTTAGPYIARQVGIGAEHDPPLGRQAVLRYLQAVFGASVTLHHGLNPEITLVSPTQASGIWAVDDKVFAGQDGHLPSRQSFGHHHDIYVRGPDGWLIESSRLTKLWPA